MSLWWNYKQKLTLHISNRNRYKTSGTSTSTQKLIIACLMSSVHLSVSLSVHLSVYLTLFNKFWTDQAFLMKFWEPYLLFTGNFLANFWDPRVLGSPGMVQIQMHLLKPWRQSITHGAISWNQWVRKRSCLVCLAAPSPKQRHWLLEKKTDGKNRKRHCSLILHRVARWLVFKPKVPIWVNFGGH
jgi:hypothetical protein